MNESVVNEMNGRRNE